MLNKLGLNPNRVMATVGALRTIIPHIQLQMTIIVKAIHAQSLADATPENLTRLLWHLVLNRRRYSQHPDSVSNFER